MPHLASTPFLTPPPRPSSPIFDARTPYAHHILVLPPPAFSYTTAHCTLPLDKGISRSNARQGIGARHRTTPHALLLLILLPTISMTDDASYASRLAYLTVPRHILRAAHATAAHRDDADDALSPLRADQTSSYVRCLTPRSYARIHRPSTQVETTRMLRRERTGIPPSLVHVMPSDYTLLDLLIHWLISFGIRSTCACGRAPSSSSTSTPAATLLLPHQHPTQTTPHPHPATYMAGPPTATPRADDATPSPSTLPHPTRNTSSTIVSFTLPHLSSSSGFDISYHHHTPHRQPDGGRHLSRRHPSLYAAPPPPLPSTSHPLHAPPTYTFPSSLSSSTTLASRYRLAPASPPLRPSPLTQPRLPPQQTKETKETPTHTRNRHGHPI
ncbi:hypothetical protein R3P38DRAFT_3177505 [Favolaschia claudopus]|uniref:Uncharacterized protein n=1 Tax=Favolaschia claudopus TaxID=2862362 RepID=A0AAW0D466_9AGAR